MPKVTEIPAKKQVGSLAKKKETRKLRVAAYCRVSTDYEEQASSYQMQIQHYTDVIEKNPDWVLAVYLQTTESVRPRQSTESSSIR